MNEEEEDLIVARCCMMHGECLDAAVRNFYLSLYLATERSLFVVLEECSHDTMRARGGMDGATQTVPFFDTMYKQRCKIYPNTVLAFTHFSPFTILIAIDLHTVSSSN